MAETLLSISEVLLYGRVMADITFNYSVPSEDVPAPGGNSADACDPPPRLPLKLGGNAQLQRQLAVDPATGFVPAFARVYGFSFEGCYYDLDAPIIMLVHGPGAVAERFAADSRASRAPESPDRSGNAAQGHSFADDIRVWSYDKADFSIRMDAISGAIEDILLEIELAGGPGPVSGGKVGGGKVAGGKVAGGKVAGGKVAGGKVAGGKVSGGKVGD